MPHRKHTVILEKEVLIPDAVKIERYKRIPELGPKMLFFTGGSALRKLSQEIVKYTHNSTHLITPFDSGGSSAKLRKAFDMLAIGDIRNRLMSLADTSLFGNPEIVNLFALRFPEDEDNDVLRERLKSMISGRTRSIKKIPDPMRKIIRNHLLFFQKKMKADFDLRGASIGNLVLTGGFLNNRRHIDPVIYIFSKLIESRGMVRPLVNCNLHIAVELENGTVLNAQHKFTGTEYPPIESKIKKLYLLSMDGEKNSAKTKLKVRIKTGNMIASADLICYPMGSFYSSLVANFLIGGVAENIVKNRCPKVYIPNLGVDPEQFGMSVEESVKTLVHYLRKDEKERIGAYLNFVIVDTQNGDYPNGIKIKKILDMGIQVIDMPLITEESSPYFDETKLLEVLCSLT